MGLEAELRSFFDCYSSLNVVSENGVCSLLECARSIPVPGEWEVLKLEERYGESSQTGVAIIMPLLGMQVLVVPLQDYCGALLPAKDNGANCWISFPRSIHRSWKPTPVTSIFQDTSKHGVLYAFQNKHLGKFVSREALVQAEADKLKGETQGVFDYSLVSVGFGRHRGSIIDMGNYKTIVDISFRMTDLGSGELERCVRHLAS
ncbi:hypothetical protein HY489_02035 [Candidatus Woesearchaeota archaeon]|nr:hypothetical protein [Candidatus Woesearchaeota archaeon]